jgi:hypothetical protein
MDDVKIFWSAILLAIKDFIRRRTCCRKHYLMYHRQIWCKDTKVLLAEYLKICKNCGREIGQEYVEIGKV